MWSLTMNSIRANPTPSAGNCHHRIAAPGDAKINITFVRVPGISLTSRVSSVHSIWPS